MLLKAAFQAVQASDGWPEAGPWQALCSLRGTLAGERLGALRLSGLQGGEARRDLGALECCAPAVSRVGEVYF